MPFIAQCPHPDCRKYQLLEDSLRGAVTNCLLCKQPLRVREGADGPQTEAVAAPPANRTPPPANRTPPPVSRTPPVSHASPPPVNAVPPPRAGVARCPKCTADLRLPWEQTVRAVKCPKCGAVFSP